MLLNSALLLATEPVQHRTKYYAIELAPDSPRFTAFSLDGLGQGKLDVNPVLSESNAPGSLNLTRVRGRAVRFQYEAAGQTGRKMGPWTVDFSEREIRLRSRYQGQPGTAFQLRFDQKANHATLLGMMKAGERQMQIPCLLHLPDMGSVRITADRKDVTLPYEARRYTPKHFVAVDFPAATEQTGTIEYRLEVTAIYPELKHKGKPAFNDEAFRRGFLNIFQVNPRMQMLANNASSDPVPFTLYEYADVARHAPPLAEGLTCLDLVRMTLDRYLSGEKGYGQAGYACAPVDADLVKWETPYTSLDVLPSLLISACDYVEGRRDLKWASTNYTKLRGWALEMIGSDKNGNGLMEYPRSGNYGDRPLREMRPANWWDTINFGHEDAYSNALIYRAAMDFAALARILGQNEHAERFERAALKLRAAYVPTFLNPETGVLAGWKSADGQLHDYWFTFVNGAAITFGLVDAKQADQIMDRMLKKMREAGFNRFDLGLPGNLVPVRKGDYASHGAPPEVHGEPRLEDGSDGFQFYENGGATGCFAIYTLRALYRLGRAEDARAIFYPMLQGYADGNFQGFCDNGMSKDWRDWQGGCHGYEGLLVDNYWALLAVFDDLKFPPRR